MQNYIETALHVFFAGRNHNLHRHRHIEGHSDGIHKGKVRAGFWIGKRTTGHKLADAYTGWGTLSRIFVEEVARAQQQTRHMRSPGL